VFSGSPDGRAASSRSIPIRSAGPSWSLLEDPELCQADAGRGFHFYNPTLTVTSKSTRSPGTLFRIHGRTAFLMTELGRPGSSSLFGRTRLLRGPRRSDTICGSFSPGRMAAHPGLGLEDAGLGPRRSRSGSLTGYREALRHLTEGYDVTGGRGRTSWPGTLDRGPRRLRRSCGRSGRFLRCPRIFLPMPGERPIPRTADLRDVYPPFDGKTPGRPIRKAFLETLSALRPLIRSPGPPSNDQRPRRRGEDPLEDTWSRTAGSRTSGRPRSPSSSGFSVVLIRRSIRAVTARRRKAAGNISSELSCSQGWRTPPTVHIFSKPRPSPAGFRGSRKGPGGTWAASP